MSNLSQAQRNALTPDKFCGQNRTFPILDQNDVDSAARLIGHAPNPAKVKACIIAKCQKNGWKIPDDWKASASGK